MSDESQFTSQMETAIQLFSEASRLTLGSTQPRVQWVLKALSLGGKGLGHETHHSPPLRIRDKNECSYTTTLQYAFMACRGMLLFTQKCGKLYSTHIWIDIFSKYVTCGFKYLIPRCSLIADRNVLFQSYMQYMKPDFIFSVCHSTFNVSNTVPNKSCNP